MSASKCKRSAIVGAGIVGTNVADELIAHGWNAESITIVEKGLDVDLL